MRQPRPPLLPSPSQATYGHGGGMVAVQVARYLRQEDEEEDQGAEAGVVVTDMVEVKEEEDEDMDDQVPIHPLWYDTDQCILHDCIIHNSYS